MTQNKRPRIKDVAKIAGVSEGTVSVVLNGRVGENVRVSESTQEKIWDAVRELGYVANPVAQSLAGGQNHIIAVFTFESIFPIDVSSFYYPFLIGIEQEADRQGYDLLLITGSTDSLSGKRRIYENNMNRLSRADGAILLGHGDKQEVYRLLQDEFPFVYVGRRESPNDNISYVAADYTSATKRIVNYLFAHGHKNIAYIRTARQNEASLDRLRGFREAHQEATIILNDSQIWSGDASNLTRQIIENYLMSDVTAFVAEDDEIGQQILLIGQQLGIHCPDEFSLAVLGNPLNPMQDVPNWTSFNIPRQEMGQKALAMLVELLQAKRDNTVELPLRQLLQCDFVAGDTVL